MSWQENAEDDFSVYEVYKGTIEGIENATLYQTGTNNVLKDEDVEYLQNYYYYLLTVDERGNKSTVSPVVSGMPLDNPPAKPEGVTVSLVHDEGIMIKWSANDETDVKAYRVYWSTDNVAENAEEVIVLESGNTQYLHSTGASGQLFYWITAVDNSNESSFSELAGLLITEIEFQKKEDLFVYPNPVSDFLRFTTSDSQADYILTNELGMRVKSGALGISREIDMRDLPSGLYICKIAADKRMRVFIISKL